MLFQCFVMCAVGHVYFLLNIDTHAQNRIDFIKSCSYERDTF